MKLLRSSMARLLQFWNIDFIFVTRDVFQLLMFRLFRLLQPENI